jgi:hypothetical protein
MGLELPRGLGLELPGYRNGPTLRMDSLAGVTGPTVQDDVLYALHSNFPLVG